MRLVGGIPDGQLRAVLGDHLSAPRDFCSDCGEALPWISRRGRIAELQRIVDIGKLPEAERSTARALLEELSAPDLAETDEVRKWQAFKKVTGRVWESAEPVMQKIAHRDYSATDLALGRRSRPRSGCRSTPSKNLAASLLAT